MVLLPHSKIESMSSVECVHGHLVRFTIYASEIVVCKRPLRVCQVARNILSAATAAVF